MSLTRSKVNKPNLWLILRQKGVIRSWNFTRKCHKIVAMSCLKFWNFLLLYIKINMPKSLPVYILHRWYGHPGSLIVQCSCMSWIPYKQAVKVSFCTTIIHRALSVVTYRYQKKKKGDMWFDGVLGKTVTTRFISICFYGMVINN